MHTKNLRTRLITIMLLSALMLTTMPVSLAHATTLSRYAGAGADDSSIGTVAWSNPGNITVRDDIAASAVLGPEAASHYIYGSTFGLNVPSYATIVGIKVAIRRRASHPGWVVDNEVRLVKGGTIVGNDKADTLTAYDGSYLVAVYGGANSLWGTTWTPAEVNDTAFGVMLSSFNKHTLNNRTVYVDSIQVTITYKTATTTGVNCTPASIGYGSSTTCTATVTRSGGFGTPTGTVDWTTDGVGDFSSSSCSLAGTGGSATCQVTYTPSEVGTGSHQITATYAGSVTYLSSSNNDIVSVTPRNITITAQAASKAYGDPDPDLTYSITSGSLINGDTLSGALSRESGEDIGTYDILQGSLSAGPNYNLTFQDATFSITARPITVTADSLFKMIGDPDPTFTYQVTSGSLLGGDSLSGSLTREPGEDLGTYLILQGTLSAPSNYDLTFVQGTLTIESDLRATFTSSAADDGWVLESSATSSIGGTSNSIGALIMGDDSQNRQYRSIVSFDTSSLPEGATITKVVLKIKRKTLVGTSPFRTHQPLLVDIRQGNFGPSVGLELVDFQDPASFKNAGTFGSTPLAGNWYKATLQDGALSYINTAGVTQLRLRFKLGDNDDMSADLLKFFSGDALPEYQPVLTIFYQP